MTMVAGFSMALGLGAAALSGGQAFKQANATTGTAAIDFSKATQCTNATASNLTYSDGVVSISADKASSKTNANNYYPGTSGQSYTHTRFYQNSVVTISAGDNYLKEFTFTTTSGYADELANSTWTDATASYSGSKVTVTPGNNKHSVSVTIANATRVTAASIPWDSEASTAPDVTVNVSKLRVAKGGSNTFNVTYVNLTSALSVTSDDTSVATVSYAPVASGNGEAVITINGVSAGTANITIASTGATSKTVEVTVYQPRTFVQIDNVSRLQEGTMVVIAAAEYDRVLGLQASNNRNSAEVTKVDNAKGESTITIDDGITGVFEIGLVDEYYTFEDVADNKYIYAAGGTENNYLRETGTLDDKAKFSVSYADGVASIVAADTTINGTMKYNTSTTAFSCYSATSTQKAVTIYMEGSELPAGAAVTSISNVQLSADSVENGETFTLTATYAPANAVEEITVGVSPLSDGDANIGTVAMNNGSLEVEITATQAGEIYFVLEAATNSVSADSSVITILNSTVIYDSGKLINTSVSADVGSANEINGLIWYNNAFESTDPALYTNDKGMQVGSGSKPVARFTLESQLFVGKDYASKNAEKINSITVNASIASGGECDMKVSLDGVQLGETIALTTTPTNYTFNVAGEAGHIMISFTNNVEKAFYLKSIVVKGANNGDISELYKIAQELELIDSCNVSAADWAAFKAKNNEATSSTYEDVIAVYEAEFSTINLYDHESEDSTSLRSSSYGTLAKYVYINNFLAGGAGSRGLFNIYHSNSALLIVVISSAIAVSALAVVLIIKKRKHN